MTYIAGTDDYSSARLPLPVVVSARRRSTKTSSTSQLRHRPSSPTGGPTSKLSALVHRVRAPSPAVLALTCLCAVSLLVNVRLLWLSDDVFAHVPPVPLSIVATLPNAHSSLNHLVIVPGHAIFMGCDATHAFSDEDWILEKWQHDGTIDAIIKHIVRGAQIAVQDPEALLVFSGGQTRPDAELTEAMSYSRLAKSGNIYEQFMPKEARIRREGLDFDRVTTENYALDSFTNLLFSIARFKEFTGRYPSKVTVVGFDFKRQRFVDVHRAALRWPADAFTYIGIDIDNVPQAALDGERTQSLEPFMRDYYGCRGSLLNKKKGRNVYRRIHPYHTSSPELEALMEYCPENNEIFPGPLPWAVP